MSMLWYALYLPYRFGLHFVDMIFSCRWSPSFLCVLSAFDICILHRPTITWYTNYFFILLIILFLQVLSGQILNSCPVIKTHHEKNLMTFFGAFDFFSTNLLKTSFILSYILFFIKTMVLLYLICTNIFLLFATVFNLLFISFSLLPL